MKAVETTVHVAASPEAALQAFLQLEAMQKWWGVERGLVEPREGGVWALAWERSEHGFKYVITGRISSLQPGRQVVITEMLYFNPERPVLGPMSLTITATRASGGCDLTIRQDGYRDGPDWDWYYKVVSWAWPEVAKDIKSYLEKQ
ncbi:MAG TPA: SRPBCC domain-containing protein [Terriglobales bacterium]|nr:SRPBCC domain-containing protein [Terriglobales bacterium]